MRREIYVNNYDLQHNSPNSIERERERERAQDLKLMRFTIDFLIKRERAQDLKLMRFTIDFLINSNT